MDAMLSAYVECALWSSSVCGEDGSDEGSLDSLGYGPDDIAPATLAAMARDCEAFARDNAADIDAASMFAEPLGHNFWLSRNGHGAGFFDMGLGAVGDRLQRAAPVYGSVDLYIGDDGKVYGQ